MQLCLHGLGLTPKPLLKMPSTSDFQNRFVVLFLMGASCLLTRCDDEERVNVKLSKLIGKWQLSEEKVSVSYRAEWVDVEDGEIIQFNADGSFSGSSRPSCNGSFEIHHDRLTLRSNCAQDIISSEFRIIKISSTLMVVTPTSIMCTDGCFYRYDKI